MMAENEMQRLADIARQEALFYAKKQHNLPLHEEASVHLAKASSGFIKPRDMNYDPNVRHRAAVRDIHSAVAKLLRKNAERLSDDSEVNENAVRKYARQVYDLRKTHFDAPSEPHSDHEGLLLKSLEDSKQHAAAEAARKEREGKNFIRRILDDLSNAILPPEGQSR